jgi:hypothetical protein
LKSSHIFVQLSLGEHGKTTLVFINKLDHLIVDEFLFLCFDAEGVTTLEVNGEVTTVFVDLPEDGDFGETVLEESAASSDDVERNPAYKHKGIVLASVVKADKRSLWEFVESFPRFFVTTTNLNVRAKERLKFEGDVTKRRVVFGCFVFRFSENDTGNQVDDLATDASRNDCPNHYQNKPASQQEGGRDAEAAEDVHDWKHTKNPSNNDVVDPPGNWRSIVASFDTEKRLKRIKHVLLLF